MFPLLVSLAFIWAVRITVAFSKGSALLKTISLGNEAFSFQKLMLLHLSVKNLILYFFTRLMLTGGELMQTEQHKLKVNWKSLKNCKFLSISWNLCSFMLFMLRFHSNPFAVVSTQTNCFLSFRCIYQFRLC